MSIFVADYADNQIRGGVKLVIKGAQVFSLEEGFVKRDIIVKDGLFVDSGDGREVVNGEDLVAVPGLVDLHMHGAVGYDITDGTQKAFKAVSDYEGKAGIGAICPATLTLPIEQLEGICREAKSFQESSMEGAELVGLHLEGPFISPKKVGAQNPAYVVGANMETLQRLYDASGGLAKILSLAPEMEGAMEFIKTASKMITCSIAHTTADYDTAIEAVKNGASYVTHLYNAMPPLHHREPSVVGAAFDSPAVMVELITDNVHIHPSMVRATFKLFGDSRIVLVSDSFRGTGMPDGQYDLGGLDVNLKGRKASLADGTVAGSATNLMDCMLRAVTEMGIPLHSAVKAASTNPAKVLGITDRYGSLEKGRVASFSLLDKENKVVKVYNRGRLIYSA